MKFYLGFHEVPPLTTPGPPLFLSLKRLYKERKPFVVRDWAIDSGAFSEISTHGCWTATPEEFVERVRWVHTWPGNPPDFVAPQDFMCEPHIIQKTGLSIREHQRLTVENLVHLRELAPEIPWMPVLQGWELDDYFECVEMYAQAGVDLLKEPIVGVGSVCRRQRTQEGCDIVIAMCSLGLPIHAFGFKISGLAQVGHSIASADSFSWSYNARMNSHSCSACPPGTCASATNCIHYAEKWAREEVESVIRSSEERHRRLETTLWL